LATRRLDDEMTETALFVAVMAMTGSWRRRKGRLRKTRKSRRTEAELWLIRHRCAA